MRGLALLSAAAALWASSAAAFPSEVSSADAGLGTRYFTAKGASLYFYARDPVGQSVCSGRCITAWPALAAPADAQAEGDWTPIIRPDGSKQWAFKGKPVYTFARDPGPGTTMGDGVQDVWHLAIDLIPRPSSILFKGTRQGWVAANLKGETLYIHDGETTAGKKRCSDECLRTWRPAVAPAVGATVGKWTVVARDDGISQWAYKGAPLYVFSGTGTEPDSKFTKEWRQLVLEPAPPLPPFVKTSPSDVGEVLTDEHRMTLYTSARVKQELKTLCLEACFKENWRAMLAAEDAKPVGNWTIGTGVYGERQWAYRGNLVYTHTRDQKPGEIEGHRFAAGVGQSGWVAIQADTLTLQNY